METQEIIGLIASLILVFIISIQVLRDNVREYLFGASGAIKSDDDYHCPNCGKAPDYGCGINAETMISRTEVVFKSEPDPHYHWLETHRCSNCQTIFTVTNGT